MSLPGLLGEPVTDREALLSEWTRCAEWLERALERDGGHYELGDVLTEVLQRRAIFWPGEQAAIVTQFWFFPRLKAINVWLAGADDPHEWKAMLPVIEAWGMLQGCGQCLVFGRKGLAKTLKDQGYDELFTGYAKTLSPSQIGRC